MMFVSLIGGGGDGGGGFWRKTSSYSCNSPLEVSTGCCWSMELKRLDSEIRSEGRRGWTDTLEDGDDMMLSLFFLFDGVASWKWVMGVGVTDETCLVFSESVSLFSKLRALLLCISFVVSSNMLESLRHCLVSLPVTMVSLFLSLSPSLLVCGRPGKVMASRLAWLSLSLACHSVPLPPGVPDGEKGQGRPTDAARVEVLLARCRSLFL